MSEKAALNDPAKTANEIATKIESAVRSDDNQSYSNALEEVDKYRASHTQDETNQLVGSIAKKLEADKLLPRVSLFEAKREFDKIDVGGDGTLQVRELNAFKGQRDVNELQQKFIDHVVKNFDTVGDHKSDWSSDSSIAMPELDAGIKAAAEREQRETALNNLFHKDDKGKSLYDKLKDEHGNIPPGAIGRLLDLDKQNPNVLGLTDQDRASLKLLNENKSINQQYNTFADDMKKDDLKKLCQDNGLAFDKLVPAETEKNKAVLESLFHKSAGGQSLYERLKDADGNVPADTVKKLLDLDAKLPAAANLSDRDREALKALSAEGITKDVLAKKCTENGLDLSKLIAGDTQTEKKSPKVGESAQPPVSDGNRSAVTGDSNPRFITPKPIGQVIKESQDQSHLRSGDKHGSSSTELHDRVNSAAHNGITTGRDTHGAQKQGDYHSSAKQGDKSALVVHGDKHQITRHGDLHGSARQGDKPALAAQGEKQQVHRLGDQYGSTKQSENNQSARQGEHDSSGRQSESQANRGDDKNHRAAAQSEQQAGASKIDPPAKVTQGDRTAAANQVEQIPVTPEPLRAMGAVEQAKSDERLKEALTVQRGESYSHCAERLLALAGNNDPTGAQIRKLARQLWIADHKREAYGLRVNQVLNLSDEIKNNKDVAKLFA